MQKWEYKSILRQRGWLDRQKDGSCHLAGSWDVNVILELEQLGEQGWELVAISPRSGVMGGYSAVGDYAGYTNEELWVFKRPKI
jgi:hypothetical protein